MKLSIIIPVYNEDKTIKQLLERVEAVRIPNIDKEVIIVNDASFDNTEKKVKEFLGEGKSGFYYSYHDKNRGKGAAVRSGISQAKGDYVVIQDADLEYNPKDITRLVNEVNKGHEVVFGTRLNRMPHFSKEERHPHFLLHYLGNKFLSLVTSILYGQWVTDMETCYKLFPSKTAKKLHLNARGFELEPEITAKLMKLGYHIHEIPITTTPRGYDEGKKLDTVKDGIKALKTLLRYRFYD